MQKKEEEEEAKKNTSFWILGGDWWFPNIKIFPKIWVENDKSFSQQSPPHLGHLPKFSARDTLQFRKRLKLCSKSLAKPMPGSNLSGF